MGLGQRRIYPSASSQSPHGVRSTHANGSAPRDTFIYEYVGDVVSPPTFKKRMRDYALEGIQHFYFMMLQKDEVSSIRPFFLFRSVTDDLSDVL